MRNEPLTILHVEDNADHACLIARHLRRHCPAGNVRLVEDGEAALDYLFQRGDYSDPEKNPRPDIILLDLRIPKLDGLDVLRTVKTTEHLLGIPVIVLTSSEAEEDLCQAYVYHANSFLMKPVDYEEFCRLLDALSTFWLDLNRQPRSAVDCCESM